MGYFSNLHAARQEEYTYDPLHKTPEGWGHIGGDREDEGRLESWHRDAPCGDDDYNDGMEQDEPFEDDVISGFGLEDD